MPDLFTSELPSNPAGLPLADRVRPSTLDEFAGQTHLIGTNGPVRKYLESGPLPSMIFWGPPGVGKTTLAYLIAKASGHDMVRLSAVDSGVKEIRSVIARAEMMKNEGRYLILFIDEIHRFHKGQQDALLHAVESGLLTLIGATTENPSFEVNAALMSRCQVYRLLPLEAGDIRAIVERALNNDVILQKMDIVIKDWDRLLSLSGGDARSALNIIDMVVRQERKAGLTRLEISRDLMENVVQHKQVLYDKAGEGHYDTISAFIKSLRGSDPDAALFWLAKMLEAGEDPKFIARRMVVFASEDIGNADPYAITLAVSVFQAVNLIGLPEARINLAQGVTYLSSCPKSNASYTAIEAALRLVKSGIDLTVPLHLRNSPTTYMKSEGYGKEYQYPHDFENHFVNQHYFPASLSPYRFYQPTRFGREEKFDDRLNSLWSNRHQQKDPDDRQAK